jgi:PAS domain-containing protein
MTQLSGELLEFLYRSPLALVTAQIDGTILKATPLACNWLMPLSKDGNLDNLFVLLDDVAPNLRALVASRTSGVICENLVVRIDQPKPPSHYLSLSVNHFCDGSIAAIFSDVSREHQQIDQAQKTLRTIVDALPAMIGYWDTQLCNQFANKAYSQYFPCDPEALRGLHIRELLGEKIYEATHSRNHSKCFPGRQQALH